METGPIGNVPLGPSKPSRVPAPPATTISATSPAASIPAPVSRARRRATRSTVGLRLADHLDRLDAARLDRRRGISLNQLVDQPVQLSKIDRRDLGLKPHALGIIQFAPPGQQVSLSVSVPDVRPGQGRGTWYASILMAQNAGPASRCMAWPVGIGPGQPA